MSDAQNKRKIILPEQHESSNESDQIPLANESIYGVKSRCITLDNQQALFIIGANGSGKTFFSTHLEKLNWGIKSKYGESFWPFKGKIVRISAQRSLQIPLTVDLIAKQQAFDELLYLNAFKTRNNILVTESPSYNKDPQAYMRSDMDTLLQYLLVDRNEINEKRRQNSDLPSIFDKIQAYLE